MDAAGLVQAHVDPAVRRRAEAVLERRGLTIPAAIELFLAQVAEDRCPLSYLHAPNTESIATIFELELGSQVRFATVGDLMADLDADD